MKRNLICHDPGRNSHKFWKVEVVGNQEHRHWGRVGTDGQRKTWTHNSNAAAMMSATSKANEKIAEGYVDVAIPATTPQAPVSVPAPVANPAPLARWSRSLRPMLCSEIDADQLPRYAGDPRFIFECKLDGQRVMLAVDTGSAKAFGRNGQASQHNPRFQDRRHTPEFGRLSRVRHVVLDGELMGDTFWVFDMPELEWSGGIEMKFEADEAWEIRRRALGLLFQAWQPNPKLFRLLPYAETEEDKLALAAQVLADHGEGIIVKRADAPYAWGGRNSNTLKAKYWNSADLVVKSLGEGGKDNAVLGAWQGGKLVEVGKCSTIGKRNVQVGDVVEVKYLYLGANGRLVQPDLLRVRSDKAVNECTHDQLRSTNKDVMA